jgi:outer membrane lipoprotein SlyB
VIELIFSGYGAALLQVADSIYPGYTYGGGFGSVIVATLYGALDGAVAGAIFAWLYNLFVPRP